MPVENPLAQMDSVVLANGPVLVASDQLGTVWQIPALGTVSDWTCHGGQALAPPLALAASQSGTAIAVLGPSGRLQVWVRGRWGRWLAPPDTTVGFAGLAAAADGDGVVHVVCISGTGQLWELLLDRSDQFAALPVLPVSLVWVVAVGTATGIVVLAIGEDDHVYAIRWKDGGSWTNLGDPPSGASELAAAQRSTGLVTACVVGSDGSLYSATQTSSRSSFDAWATVGSGTPPGVEAVRSLALARGSGDAVWAHVVAASGAWRTRISDGHTERIGLPPGVTDLLTLTAFPMGDDTAVAALGHDGAPWRAVRSGSGWRWSALPAVPPSTAPRVVRAVRRASEAALALSSPFSMCCFLTAHNAFANPADGWAYCQQGLSLARQLEYGVRALMLDAWDCTISGERDAYLAHSADWVQEHLPSPCATFKVFLDPGQEPQTLASAFATIADFLTDPRNRDQVVTAFLESHLGDPPLVAAALAEVSSLVFYADRINEGSPTNWNVATDGWPTLQWMVNNDKRLVIFSENKDDAPALPYIYDWVVETVYGNASLAPACVPRPESLPLDTPQKLFIMNHFPTSSSQNIPWHDSYDQINDADALAAQRDRCHTAAMKYPNFVAVDYVEIGSNGGPSRAVSDINNLMASPTRAHTIRRSC